MVVIRLSRVGKKKQAFYRIVVADSRRPVTAKFIEILGWYNPHSKELNINKEKTETWFSNGATPSNSVAILFEKNEIKLPSWVKIKQKNKKPKKAVVPGGEETILINEEKEEVEQTKEANLSDSKIMEAENTVEEPVAEEIEKLTDNIKKEDNHAS